MAKVIRFPAERSRPHVALVWDCAWDMYRVGPVGCIAPAATEQYFSDHGEALDCLLAMSERLGLPAIDITVKGKVA